MINAKRKKRAHSKMNRSYYFILLIFIGIFLISVAFSYQYYGRLYTTIKEENQLYLQEITKRISTNIDRIIKDNYSILNTMAVSVNNTEKLTDIQKLLQKQKSYWNYDDILLVDEDGRVYDTGGREIFLSFDDNMRDKILNAEQAMSTTQNLNNEEYIFFSVPLSDVKFNDTNMIALVASYNQSSFDSVLSMSSFSEMAYSQIVKKSGTVVTLSSSEYAIDGGYNIFSTIEKSDIDKEYNMENVISEINDDIIGMMSFTHNGTSRYMVYTPIKVIEEWTLLTFVPVDVVNQKSNTLLKSTILLCGLIAGVFALLIAALIALFGSHRRKLESIAYIDAVTTGNTIQRFYDVSRKLIDSNSEIKYALVYTNMEKFKVLNEQYGKETCDSILKMFYDQINNVLTENECVGRISADNFCLLLEYDSEENLVTRFTAWQQSAEKYIEESDVIWLLPSVEMGVYVIDNRTLTFPQMIDRAKLSLKESCRAINNKLKYAIYDDETRRKMMREKELEDKMENALQTNEFKLYLQPKYKLPAEVVSGAEALVRWESKTEGMIFPNEFIPLFEKNGFVVNVDLWIFEEVCKKIREWLDNGLTPVKISVNCSRVHFRDPKFLSLYTQISEKYKIDRKYLEIELTESVVFENTKLLIQIIEDIRAAGFGCSIDDFGSGYSSLNMIQSIPVDTLKLDRIFFIQNSSDTSRTESVVSSIISLAKSLSMETVAEGVEYTSQIQMLKDAGCDYIQGYVFAKPMKVEDFEKLVFPQTYTQDNAQQQDKQ